MDYKKYIIYWNKNDFYKYGSQTTFHRNSVKFKNDLMSPGKSIVSWTDSLNYQASRTFPQLPLLRKGRTYYVAIKVETIPENSAYLKIDFKDNLNESIKKVYIKDQLGSFEFPQNAHSYTMELMNAGCKQIKFQQIEISETPIIWDDYEFMEFLRPSDELTVLLVEPNHHVIPSVERKYVKKLGNTMAIASSLWGGDFFISSEVENYLRDMKDKYQRVRLISYGAYGNVGVKYYNSLLDLPGYVTNEELSLEEIESGKQNMSEKERTTLLQAYQNSQVKIWYQGSNEEVGFVKTLVNGISRLQNFKD
ncbi:accessory Sec system protein Asp3 [Ligilactobacillus salivarius]|uniref:accessory Sec system protein Asp3 n=1 Tax=Ligilactobacillus salivarius TaxID=1624 RepID=UPI002103E9E2|nr:accessory Sec system protein Asp3 [Ligilactobacillus salivarius]UTX36740.1 accessory Sec system protein Asp3 [Ligilactobacillus salivarius]